MKIKLCSMMLLCSLTHLAQAAEPERQPADKADCDARFAARQAQMQQQLAAVMMQTEQRMAANFEQAAEAGSNGGQNNQSPVITAEDYSFGRQSLDPAQVGERRPFTKEPTNRFLFQASGAANAGGFVALVGVGLCCLVPSELRTKVALGTAIVAPIAAFAGWKRADAQYQNLLDKRENERQ